MSLRTDAGIALRKASLGRSLKGRKGPKTGPAREIGQFERGKTEGIESAKETSKARTKWPGKKKSPDRKVRIIL